MLEKAVNDFFSNFQLIMILALEILYLQT